MDLDAKELARFDVATPRYTSYPTAPEWEPLEVSEYEERLRECGRRGEATSVYVHVPFCKTMCLYCACSVVLNRQPENEERYVRSLLKEVELVRGLLARRQSVTQLHLGGGTPTQLSEGLLTRLMEGLREAFEIDTLGEVAIEIDPRTVLDGEGAKLRHLKRLGFNRVSFGVQDTDERVQEAVKRRQSLEMTRAAYELSRELEFGSVNIDLIYGLPYQTAATFQRTVQEILKMRPNRIAMFSYAKVPWLKAHQRAIKEETLPSTEEKFQIYLEARREFLAAGYVAVGMDHFALESDGLSLALRSKSLQRNFQGYSLRLAEDLIGLGLSATGFVSRCYGQNAKELEEYYAAVDGGQLPIFRGKRLSQDDETRRWTIHKLMCDFELDKGEFEARFGRSFDSYYAGEQAGLARLVAQGLLCVDEKRLVPTLYGSLFIRTVASTFDGYLAREGGHRLFSKGV